MFSREDHLQCRTVIASEESSVRPPVVKVVNFGDLRPHRVEETRFTSFIEPLNGPQEVVNRLEADGGTGV